MFNYHLKTGSCQGKISNNNILGMISMDMIAYNGSGANRVTIGGQTTSLPIKEALVDAVTLYGDGISPEIYGHLNGRDNCAV